MDNREKLLIAASRVYAEVGFRGATTRRIAEEAGVNEVTLFRLFGSKAQLLAEAITCHDPMGSVLLPVGPADPMRELTEWSEGHLVAIREMRGMIRKTMADLEEHPDVYKPVEPVVASLVREGAAARVAALVPLVTVKR